MAIPDENPGEHLDVFLTCAEIYDAGPEDKAGVYNGVGDKNFAAGLETNENFFVQFVEIFRHRLFVPSSSQIFRYIAESSYTEIAGEGFERGFFGDEAVHLPCEADIFFNHFDVPLSSDLF